MKKFKFVCFIFLMIMSLGILCSCGVEPGLVGPQGEQGIQGETGKDGIDGTNGKDGNGVVSINKTSSEGLVDTYTITFTNGDKTTFTVTNGKDGKSAYQVYLESYPEYIGTEKEWLEDLINGKLIAIK